MSVSEVPRLGAHVGRAKVIADAEKFGVDCVQVHLSAPQAWAPPKLKGDESALAASGLHIYVHGPYLVNPSSIRPELREQSRECLIGQAEACAAVSARGLVVHAGHPTGDGTLEHAVDGWLDTLNGWTSPVPILIENTAGGSFGPGRYLEPLVRLVSLLRDRTSHEIGVCFDTCHAWASGMALDVAVDVLTTELGGISLVHLNDSKDEQGSGRDRHQNLGMGEIPLEWITDVVNTAGCDVVIETPGGFDGQFADLEWLREHTTITSRA